MEKSVFKTIAVGILFGLMAFTPKMQDYKTVRWWMLQDVTFEDVYMPNEDTYFLKPTFGESVQKLSNQMIEISGYIIPVDISAGMYVLSAYPFSACYFCGGAGPESVMELQFKEAPDKKFKTDEYLKFRGRLRLNDTNLEQLNYVLLGAEYVNP